MLTIAKDHIINNINSELEVVMYGQESDEITYAVAKSDVLIMGEEADNIRFGSSFKNDKFTGNKFNYMLSNPPFGVRMKLILVKYKELQIMTLIIHTPIRDLVDI